MGINKLPDWLGYGKDLEEVPLLDVIGLFLLIVLLATLIPN